MATSTKILILGLALSALYYFARYARLGHGLTVKDAEHAKQIAYEELIGFQGDEVLIDRSGQSALVRGGVDTYAYIRRHGAHFVVRQIGGTEIIQCGAEKILLRHPDLPKGGVTMQVTHAAEPRTAQFTAYDKR